MRIVRDADGAGGTDARTTRLRCPSQRRATACRRLRALPRSALAPVPDDVVCTQLYGGPQTGRIEGTIAGRRVAARFRRTNGCEIARYGRVAPVLRLAR